MDKRADINRKGQNTYRAKLRRAALSIGFRDNDKSRAESQMLTAIGNVYYIPIPADLVTPEILKIINDRIKDDTLS